MPFQSISTASPSQSADPIADASDTASTSLQPLSDPCSCPISSSDASSGYTTDELSWLRTLYEQLPAICLTLDGAGQIRAVSHFGAEKLGYVPLDLVGRGFWELLPDSNPALVDAYLTEWQRSPQTPHTWVGRLRCSDGRWLSGKATVQVVQQQHRTAFVLVLNAEWVEPTQPITAPQPDDPAQDWVAALRFAPFVITTFLLGSDRQISHLSWIGATEALFGFTAIDLQHSPEHWLLGLDGEEQRNMTGDRFLHLTQGEGMNATYRYHHPDGSIRWITSQATAVWNLQYQRYQVTILSTDVTHQKRACASQAQSEHRLSVLLDQASVSICGFRVYGDRRMYCDYFSQGCERVFGYGPTVQQANPGLWRSRIHPDDAEKVEAQVFEAILAEQSITIEYRFRHHCGAWRWISSTYSSNWSDEAQCWKGTVVDVDITERKHLELALQKSQAELAYVMDSATAAIFKWCYYPDYSWDYDYISAGCAAIYGHEAVAYSVNPRLWENQIHPDDRDRVLDELHQAIIQQKRFTHEFRCYHKDGSLRWIASTYFSEWNEIAQHWQVVTVDFDVTQRHQIEDTLRQHKTRLASAQRLAQVAYWDYDVQQNQVKFSDEYRHWKMPGWDDHPSVEQVLDSLYPADRARLREAVNRAIAQAEPINLDLRRLDHQNTPLYLAVRGRVSFNREGEAYRISGTVQNITERKHLEEQVRQQYQRAQLLNQVIKALRNSLELPTVFETAAMQTTLLLELNQVYIAEYQPGFGNWRLCHSYTVPSFVPTAQETAQETTFLANSPKITDALKRGKTVPLAATSETVGRSLFVPLHHDYQLWGVLVLVKHAQTYPWQDWEVELAEAIADQLAIAIQQSQLFHQVKQLNTQLESTVAKRTRTLSRSLQYEHLLRRITDRVRDSLDEAQILQAVVQELLGGLGLDCCDSGMYDLENRTSTVVYEATQSLPPAKNTIVNMADYPHIYRKLAEGESLQICALPSTQHRDPQTISAMLVCPIYDDQGMLGDLWLFRSADAEFDELEVRLVEQVASHCAIALRQSRLYEAAQKQVQELAKLNTLKDDFLSTVSHELRSPMANIKMAIEVLEYQLNQDGCLCQNDDRTLQYFNILRDECVRESNLINDLLDLSRLDAESEPLITSTLSLRDWLLHLSEAFAQRTKTHHQALSFDIPTDLPPLTTDFTFLESVVTELLHNACKYTPEGGQITVSARHQTPESSHPNLGPTQNSPDLWKTRHWQIIVCNTGVEIAPDEQTKIFDKFYRIPNNDPWRTGGTGLGLALVKKRVERLGGQIQVVSQQQTTQFVIQLPG